MESGLDRNQLAYVCLCLKLLIQYSFVFILPELCDELSDPTNGGVTWNDLTEGSVATYHCDNGYQLIRDEIRTCEDGEWSRQEPTCISMCLPQTAYTIIIRFYFARVV